MPMIKEGTYEKPERPKSSVPPGQRGSDTKQANQSSDQSSSSSSEEVPSEPSTQEDSSSGDS
jgi:hypothetical protein